MRHPNDIVHNVISAVNNAGDDSPAVLSASSARYSAFNDTDDMLENGFPTPESSRSSPSSLHPPLLDGDDDDAQRNQSVVLPGLKCSVHGPILLCMSQALFLWCVTYSTFVPLLAFYSKEEGFGPSGIGIVSAALQVGWFVALPLLPWITQRIGARRVVFLGVTSFAAAPLLVAAYPGLVTLLGTRLLEGFGMALLMPTLDAELTRQFPPELRARSFAVRGVLGQLGRGFGLIVATAIHQSGGLVLTMFIIAAIGAVVLVADVCFIPAHWFQSKKDCDMATSDSDAAAAAPSDGNKTEASDGDVADAACVQQQTYWDVFRALWRRSDMATLLIHHFFCQVSLGAVLIAAPLYLCNKFDMSMIELSTTWLIFDILRFLATFAGGRLADRCNVYKMNVLILGIQPAIFLSIGVLDWSLSEYCALTLSQEKCVFVGLVGLWYALGMTSGTGLNGAAFSKLITDEARCSASSLSELWTTVHFLTSVAMVIGSVFAGFEYAAHGFDPVIYIAGSTQAASFVAFVLYNKDLSARNKH